MKCPKCGAFLMTDGSRYKGDERFLCIGGHSFWWGSREYDAIKDQRQMMARG